MKCSYLYEIPDEASTGFVPEFVSIVIDGATVTIPAPIPFNETQNIKKSFIQHILKSGESISLSRDTTNQIYKLYVNCTSRTFGDLNITIDGAPQAISVGDCDPATCQDDCFSTLVGIKDLCSNEDFSLYLDDVGISKTFVDKIINSEYKNGFDFYQAKYGLAIEKLKKKLAIYLASVMKNKSVLENLRLGHLKDNRVVITGSEFKGIEIELNNISSYLSFELTELSIALTTSEIVDILVYNVTTGQLLDVITITSDANNISVLELRNAYKSNKKDLHIALIYDSTGIDSLKTELSKTGCGTCSKGYFYNQIISANGVKINAGDDILDTNLRRQSETGGLGIVFNVTCDYEAWLCSIASSIGLSLLYLTAEEIYNYALLNSKRINDEAFFSEDELKQLVANSHSEFETSLQTVLQNMNLPTDKYCFRCESPIKSFAHVSP